MKMDECIEREVALERLRKIVEVNRLCPDRAWFTPAGVEYLIREIPAADVRPVEHGVWIKIKYRSICRDCSFRGFASWKYCPNCGLRMTTEGDNGQQKIYQR